MNMPYHDYMDQQNEYQRSGDTRGESEHPSHRRKKQSYSRRGKGPTAFNGIHRRRNKRISW